MQHGVHSRIEKTAINATLSEPNLQFVGKNLEIYPFLRFGTPSAMSIHSVAIG
jgi:hypothetical protein